MPNWYKWGGRTDPYALEWTTQGSGSEFYTLPSTITGGALPPDFTITLWFKPTGTYVATRYGLLGIYRTPIDELSLVIDGTGNNLELRGLAGLLASGSIQSGWNNATILQSGSNLLLYINGVQQGASATAVGAVPYDDITLGVTHYVGAVPPSTFLDLTIVDEIAIFESAIDPVVIYNQGVPLRYEDGYPDLVASYGVEKETGAIHTNSIPIEFKKDATVTEIFSWGGIGANSVVQVTTTALRSTDTNPFKEMADNYGDYGRGISSATRDSRTPLGTGNSIEELANGLMPFPAGGGFDTTGYANAFVGSADEPHLSPQVSKAITMSTGDSTDYDAIGGSNTLSGVTDARSGKLFPPTFVKKP